MDETIIDPKLVSQPGAADSLMMGMSFGGILASVIFGIIGMAYLAQAKKNNSFVWMISGGILVGYTFFVTNTLLIILIGVVVCAAPFLCKKLGLE